MKIKINENESYDINVPEKEIDAQTFKGFFERLKIISNIIGKAADELSSDDKEYKQYKSRKNRTGYSKLINNVEDLKRLQELFYNSNKNEELRELLKKENLPYDRNKLSIALSQFRKRFGVSKIKKSKYG